MKKISKQSFKLGKRDEIPDDGDPSNMTSSPAQESSKSEAESSIAMSSQLDFCCCSLFLFGKAMSIQL